MGFGVVVVTVVVVPDASVPVPEPDAAALPDAPVEALAVAATVVVPLPSSAYLSGKVFRISHRWAKTPLSEKVRGVEALRDVFELLCAEMLSECTETERRSKDNDHHIP